MMQKNEADAYRGMQRKQGTVAETHMGLSKRTCLELNVVSARMQVLLWINHWVQKGVGDSKNPGTPDM